jgi:hypothetical protein
MQFGAIWNNVVACVAADSDGHVTIGGTQPTCLADARHTPTHTALEGANAAGPTRRLHLVALTGREEFDHSSLSVPLRCEKTHLPPVPTFLACFHAALRPASRHLAHACLAPSRDTIRPFATLLECCKGVALRRCCITSLWAQSQARNTSIPERMRILSLGARS